jgi:hypothetical protein
MYLVGYLYNQDVRSARIVPEHSLPGLVLGIAEARYCRNKNALARWPVSHLPPRRWSAIRRS